MNDKKQRKRLKRMLTLLDKIEKGSRKAFDKGIITERHLNADLKDIELLRERPTEALQAMK